MRLRGARDAEPLRADSRGRSGHEPRRTVVHAASEVHIVVAGPRVLPLRRLLVWPACAAALIIAVWVGVAVGLRLAYADRILPGTQMAGLSLGGRSIDDARRLLAYVDAPTSPVVLTAAGKRFVLTARQAGYRLDVEASVERARDAGRGGPLRGLWSTVASLLSARSLEPMSHVDRWRLRARVATIARRVDRRPSDGALIADAHALGGIRATAPSPGRTLDRDAAAAAIVAALHDRQHRPTPLPVEVRAAASSDEVQRLARRARDYLRVPLQLRVPMRLADGTRTLTLSARRAARILALERVPNTDAPGLRLRLGVDRAEVRRLLGGLADELDRDPTDAQISAPARPPLVVDTQGDLRWRPRPANVTVRPSAAGRTLQRAAAAAALSRAVGAGRHTVSLAFTRRDAHVATGPARGVTSLLGTFTTRYPCCQPRVTNIRLIARAVDGSVVLPGERFSLNRATGQRTRADGYVEAPFIADGKIVPSVGGGVSQFSTTLYNAAYFAGLQIDTHRPHSFYIDRYPAGREATLNFPDIDLVWTNDTTSPVLIRATTDATAVTVSLYGADHRRRVRSVAGARIPIAGGDFAIAVTRVVRYRDGRTARQPYTTRYDRPPPPE